MVKLCEIKRQVLLADMMECSDHSALEQGEKSFNSICRNEPVFFATGIFSHCVFNRMMAVVLSDDTIAGMFVRVNFRTPFDIFMNDSLQVFARHRLHDAATHAATAFKQRHNRNFSLARTTANIFLFAADVCLIHFNCAREFSDERWVFQSKPNPVRHKQRCAIAAQFPEVALQIGERANSLFGTANHIPSNQPFAERDMTGFKNCSNRNGKWLFAFGTPAQSGASFGRWIRVNI